MTNLVLFCMAFVAFVAYSEACSCLPQHPQTQFCSSDFVVQAKVLSRKTIRRRGQVVYTVRIQRDFKEDRRRYSSIQKIYTSDSSASCGSYFELNKKYLISGSIRGRKWSTGLCSWNTRTSSLPKYQNVELKRGLYKNNCSCKIVDCTFEGMQCPENRNTCVIRSDANCWYRNNACTQEPYGCAWQSPACARPQYGGYRSQH